MMVGGWSTTEKEHKEEVEKCIQTLYQQLRHDKNLGTMTPLTRECFEKLGNLYGYLTTEERREIGDVMSDMGVALLFLKYANILQKDDDTVVEYDRECMEVMLRLFRDFTGSSEKLRVECGKSRMLSKLTSDLSSCSGNIGDETDQVLEVTSARLAILHNCSKSIDNLTYFVEANAIQAIRPYSEQQKSELVKMLAVLTLCYIMREVDKRSVGESMIEFILEYLERVVFSSGCRHENLPTEDIVDGLSKLAIAAIFKSNSILDILEELMEKGQPGEKRAAVNALYALSLDKSKRDKITSRPKIIHSLEEIGKSALTSNPPTLLESSARGALWELRQKQDVIDEVVSDRAPCQSSAVPVADESNKKHIMISYNQRSEDICHKIYERLRREKYRLWIDVKHMEVDMFKSMANAVKNSAVFLMCMSLGYENSKFCQSEAKLAFECRINTIPVLVEQGYKKDGWLELVAAGKLYIDLSREDKFEEGIAELLKHIGEKGKCSGDDPLIAPEREETRPVALPVKEWSVEQVQKWATALNLEPRGLKIWTEKLLRFCASSRTRHRFSSMNSLLDD